MNGAEDIDHVGDLDRDEQKLKSRDLLAIKGLAQFERFPAVVALGDLIERWHISNLNIHRARREQEAGYAEHLSRDGDNLALVVKYLHDNYVEVFNAIVRQMEMRVPGLSRVEAKQTEDGRILLRFRDGAFELPFLAKHVSDGTIKMLAYLTLLYDPDPHPVLCVEEPENHLFPTLLEELAEEFRAYAQRGGQVFVSTQSPDFLNGARVNEVFWLIKSDGYTDVVCGQDNGQVAAYMRNGDKMGYLLKQRLFDGVYPGS